MKLLLKCTVIAVTVTLFSCGRSNKSTAVMQDLAMPNEATMKEGMATMSADTVGAASGAPTVVLQSGQPNANTDWDKKIIKTADINLEVKDYKTFNNFIHNNARRFGAFISAEQQNQSDIKIENTVSIKVPVGQFDDLMNSLSTDDVKVIEKRIATEDVTGEVIDTKARVDARMQVRDRYLELLKQAKTMKDILEVQKEINAIQEDIEAGSGRVEYLNHQAAYSTINLIYFQYINGSNQGNETPGFYTKLKEAFSEGGTIITGFLLFIVTIWPLLLVAFMIWFFIKRLYSKDTTGTKNIVHTVNN